MASGRARVTNGSLALRTSAQARTEYRRNKTNTVGVVPDESIDEPRQRTFADRIFDTIGAEEPRRPYIINPGSPFMKFWNVFNALFIIVCALFLPWQLAFAYEYRGGWAEKQWDQVFWSLMFPIIDTYFWIDIVGTRSSSSNNI